MDLKDITDFIQLYPGFTLLLIVLLIFTRMGTDSKMLQLRRLVFSFLVRKAILPDRRRKKVDRLESGKTQFVTHADGNVYVRGGTGGGLKHLRRRSGDAN